MQDFYKTISHQTEGIYKEKGSKFLSFAYPLYQLSETEVHLSFLKKNYHDARHHCFAFRFGVDGKHFRANDDNEPTYTAGKPILGQIDSIGLTNVLVVVVRYFGGTLLGKGGLVNAYKTAAHDALDKANVIEKTVDDFYEIICGYEQLSAVLKVLKDNRVEPENQVFTEKCKVKVGLRKTKSEQIVDKIMLIKDTSLKYLYTV